MKPLINCLIENQALLSKNMYRTQKINHLISLICIVLLYFLHAIHYISFEMNTSPLNQGELRENNNNKQTWYLEK
jgi:hypothetical protein